MARKRRIAKHRLSGRQCAALPLAERGGELQVLLVTSRETRRWVLPKGWVEEPAPPHEQAAREAYEEAGLVGEVAAEPVGRYVYDKRLPGGRILPCEVEVFPLRVLRQLKSWPEKRQRRTAWFTLPQAALVVEEGGLAMLLLRLALPER
ncbi:NUDIX hydrolase [Paracraurococcus ruber]|uniref:NUDIX hydrolase n=1 Tax=Paracraurococcus ruber TaxID=77675 RepID=A0ABS1D3U2_9PROT|nr:NUDIX hydrolase [Paracraurococcus ruber]MBK1661512.1 NUDIX hydrolase [Paracraurococcus ruber]